MLKYNIYIDESCHLENDGIPVMCIGYVKSPEHKYEEIKNKIKSIKLEHRNPMELKWNKVSSSRLPMYKELIDLFFDSELEFRCILVKYKGKLNHNQFNGGSHDNFYYKMIYYLLRPNSLPNNFRVFLDIKDTRGREKLKKIGEVFESFYGNNPSPFTHFQHLDSSDSILMQITDLFIGAITFKSRGLHKQENVNPTKVAIVKYLEEKSGYVLDEGTEPWEEKFNIFDHQPKQRS